MSDIRGVPSIPRVFLEFPGVPCGSLGFPGVPQGSPGYPGVPRGLGSLEFVFISSEGDAFNQTRPENYRDDFHQLFARRLAADGDVFLGASASDVADGIWAMAKQRGHAFAEGTNPLDVEPQFLLAPGQYKRYCEYNKDKRRCFSHGSYIADLDQNPLRCKAGRNVPTILRHGMMWSWQRGRAVLPSELWTSMGFHVLPGAQDEFQSQVCPLIGPASRSIAHKLLGNGWHLPSVGAFIMYMLSNIVARPHLDVFADCSLLALASEMANDAEETSEGDAV